MFNKSNNKNKSTIKEGLSNRKIIYVDANYKAQACRISLYEPANNKFPEYKEVTQLYTDLFGFKGISDVEHFAIFYAFLHAKRRGYENVVIITDNKSGADKFNSLLPGVVVAWIPRELNYVADSICKTPPPGTLDKVSKESQRLLNFIYNELIDKYEVE